MRMGDMDRYLECRGFLVERTYNKVTKRYYFTIKRNGLGVTRDWEWPENIGESARDVGQQIFLEDLMDCWDNAWHDGVDNGDIGFGVNMAIKDVIFNDPATIVLWADGTKTVVKAQGLDDFDPEKGLAMAISKKALGNKGNYYNTFGKWLDKYYARCRMINIDEVHEWPSIMGTIYEQFKQALSLGMTAKPNKPVIPTVNRITAELKEFKTLNWSSKYDTETRTFTFVISDDGGLMYIEAVDAVINILTGSSVIWDCSYDSENHQRVFRIHSPATYERRDS